MAEIERKYQKIFCGALSPNGNIAKYGSYKSGNKSYSDDLDQIQTNSWLNGLIGSVNPSKAPYLQDFNAIFYTITKQLAYMFQAGIPQWNSETEYFAGKSFVRHNTDIYIALQNNTNKLPTDADYWMNIKNTFFNQRFANLINGYPAGTILNYNSTDGHMIRIISLIDNNTNIPTENNIKNPGKDPSGIYYWEDISSTFSYVWASGSLNTPQVNLKPIISSGIGNIKMSGGSQSGYGGHIDFNFNGQDDDNTSRIIEDEYRKLNLVCANGLKVNNHKQRSLIETSSGSSGSSNWWLNKYDDGYIEQGGMIYTRADGTGLGDIYFPNPINNVENMIAVPGVLGVDTTTSLDNFLGIRIYELTTTYMRVKTFYARNGRIGSAGGIQVSWWIKGK